MFSVPARGEKPSGGDVEVSKEEHHDTSPPLRDIPGKEGAAEQRREKPLRLIPSGNAGGDREDTALQTTTSPAVSTTAGLNFAGVGNGDYGFAPDAAPPDTNGAVGAT